MARFVFVVLTIGALITPAPAEGQLVGGVFGARARDSFGGTNGLGAEFGVSLPLIPLDVFGSGTLFNPACAGCELDGWSLGAKVRISSRSLFPPPCSLVSTCQTPRSQMCSS